MDCHRNKPAVGRGRSTLVPEVNDGGDDAGPCPTADGMVLYYSGAMLHPWSIYVTGRADNEAAIRHVADIYAHAE